MEIFLCAYLSGFEITKYWHWSDSLISQALALIFIVQKDLF